MVMLKTVDPERACGRCRYYRPNLSGALCGRFARGISTDTAEVEWCSTGMNRKGDCRGFDGRIDFEMLRWVFGFLPRAYYRRPEVISIEEEIGPRPERPPPSLLPMDRGATAEPSRQRELRSVPKS